ncbi:ATP-binding protein [Streptomyces sp. A0642]|uniref:ATP-binding protein n=1 Tax=Streptomyces sp. A0642 TaxID=2563100 RepID=UPI0010A29104|nr:ATP-binding protein [Streptomyces sp. A0642]THA70879.1 ATP-binding protein [Streptomyces sp. A0642]
MSIWWSLHLRREAASVPLARRFLLGTMESAGVDPDVSFDLSLALSEACANAVEHGGAHGVPGGTPESWDAWEEPSAAACGQYRVTAYLDGEKCRIEVADSGPGFPARRALRTAAQHHEAHQHEPQHHEAQQHEPQHHEAQHQEAAPSGGTWQPYAEHPSLTAEDGRGLCLIEQLADHVHFGNRPGRGGAVVSFDKVLKWREGALLMVS